MNSPTLWLTALIVALLLDGGFMLVVRWRRSRQQAPSVPAADSVRVFGEVSPVLTWLRRRVLARGAQVAAARPAGPAQAPAPPADPVLARWRWLARLTLTRSAPDPAAPTGQNLPPSPSRPSMPTNLVPTPDPESAPEVQIVTTGVDETSVRVILDIPVGATVQITVETAPALRGAATGTAPAVFVRTLLPAEPEPLGLAAPVTPMQRAPAVAERMPAAVAEPAAAGALAAPVPAPVLPAPVASAAPPVARPLAPRPAAPSRLAMAFSPLLAHPLAQRVRAWPLATTFFSVALVIYLLTRLWGIDRFPLFFYSDEANYVIFGHELLERGLRGSDGQLLPLYFEADSNRYAPFTVVYFQLLTSSLFGNSIFVARATNAVISLLCVVAVSLLLRDVFKSRFWWAAVLILGMAPAYFLYSRVVFEMIIMASFYAAFLWCYLLYRTRSPRYWYLTLLMAAGTFYAYSAAQPMMLLTAVLLGVADYRYHLAHWRTLLKGLPLALVLAVPFLRFRMAHPVALEVHLAAIFSYWVEDISLGQKIATFFGYYAYGLSPLYWFLPNAREDAVLPNQHIPGQAHMPLLWLPFVVVGVWQVLRQVRDPRYRALLLATLAIPAASVLDSIEIRRMLAMLAPLTILAVLGLDWVLARLEARFRNRLTFSRQAAAVLGLLVFANLWLLGSALINGPTWITDYGLGGVQFGVKQIFEDTLPRYLRADPTVRIAVSPVFANNTHVFPRFFYSQADQERVSMGVIYDYLREKRDLSNTLMVMTAAEYDAVRDSLELKSLDVLETLYYPTGLPSFYVTRPVYADNIDALIEQAREARRKPVEVQLELDGEKVTVAHSVLGDGDIATVFDGDLGSVVRGLEANPFILGVTFSQPRAITGAALTIGSLEDVTVTAFLTPPGGEPVRFEQNFKGLPPDPTIDLAFPDAPAEVIAIRFEIKNNLAGEAAQIHVRELDWR